MYKKLNIYYFSGTGNSKNVVDWISDECEKHEIVVEKINISNTHRRNLAKPNENELIVFTSPIHGFNYPPIMFHFIINFPKGNNDIILMNTRAGMKVGKFITPGLTGIAFYLSSVILMFKGYNIKGFFPVDLPSNWISIHPGLNDKTIKYLHEKNFIKVKEFINKILEGRLYFKCKKEIIQDLLISPIAVLYYIIGRFVLSKTYYASASCNNCGACIKNCPVNAIKEVSGKPYWTYHCESCMKCMSNCPEKAIETGHGFIISIIFLFSFLSTQINLTFNKYFFTTSNPVVEFILEQVVFFIVLTIGYRFFHYLKRFKIINRIAVYTSLTKYKFWGKRYKAIKIK